MVECCGVHEMGCGDGLGMVWACVPVNMTSEDISCWRARSARVSATPPECVLRQ